MFHAFMELDELNEAKSLKEYTYNDSHHKVEIVYETDNYLVEFHPDAPKKYWVLDKSVVNPLHAIETFYDEERAIDFANMLTDKLIEASYTRPELISKLEASGKNYKFDKYTDAQLYRMWQRLQQPVKVTKKPKHELDLDFDNERVMYCDCGIRLSDAGFCPVCHDGEEDLGDDIFSDMADELYEWKNSSGKPINLSSTSASTTSQPTVVQTQQTPAPHLPSGKYAVRIVSDHGRLRALGTDGVHPAAWVAFPNDLRQFEGQQYEVDQLIWNGKNYRVAGNIVEI